MNDSIDSKNNYWERKRNKERDREKGEADRKSDL